MTFLCFCTRQGGKVHVFSLFKEEVIVLMFDLHFRQIQIQGIWLTQASSSRHHTAILPVESSEQSSVKVSGFLLDKTDPFQQDLVMQVLNFNSLAAACKVVFAISSMSVSRWREVLQGGVVACMSA